MEAYQISPENLPDLTIQRLTPCDITNPLKKTGIRFINDDASVAVYANSAQLQNYLKFKNTDQPPTFEMAGPREKIHFDPDKTTAAIVTCGGLCPGLNDVIRSLTLTAVWQYGVKKVIGFRYGYAGLSSNSLAAPIDLTPETVEDLHTVGGTILGSSRGHQDPADMVDQLVANDINILFTIGGDGTIRGASKIAQEIDRRNLDISVIGVPKTIDNDITGVERSFGFLTAVEQAREAIVGAHNEAKGAYNGIGLVKLMGRDSGFIAAEATLANSDVNFCMIPEVPVRLNGDGGFLETLKTRLHQKHHAVIVLAERLEITDIPKQEHTETDASGNIKYPDIGLYMKKRIEEYFTEKNVPISLKYIDPSYIIRSHTANSEDSAFCLKLAQHAVHAAMSGRTNMVISNWNQHFTHIPMALATTGRKTINPNADLWQSVLIATGSVVAPKHQEQARLHLLS